MAIISENKKEMPRRYGSAQFRYAMVYVLITMAVLIFLNLYCYSTTRQIFFNSKKSAMVEKCLMASGQVAELDVLNTVTVTQAVAEMSSLKAQRLIITDQNGHTIYDSAPDGSALGHYALLPEIVQALTQSPGAPLGNNVFTWAYSDGVMYSRAATPVCVYGTVVGCVYMTESDVEQGALFQNLNRNISSITLVLELVLLLFSLTYARTFSRRLRKIMQSMRIIQEGDYSHRLALGGNDELTFLGNEFNDLTERLQTSERKRRQFVSDASHELKTPLASIKLLTDSILQNDMDMDTVREFVEDIGNEAERLNRLSQKLLSLNRIESQQDGECEIVTMLPTVQRVLRMLQALADTNGIGMDIQVLHNCPILILEDDLHQIAFNLAENGIKYNIPGGKLTVTLDRQEDNALLRFSDTGIGIPQDAVGHVFERFFRVDKARSRQSGGSGLGLAIVRNLVERNHGTIRVDSTPGQGTTFTVSFPIFDTEEENA